MTTQAPVNVLSLHWGFSIGGVGKYAAIIDKMSDSTNINIFNVVIIIPGKHVDYDTMRDLRNVETIQLKSIFDPSWMWRLSKIINAYKASLIITHGFNGHFLMVVERYLSRINIPLVCSYHGEYHATTTWRKLIGYIYNRFTEFYIRHCVRGVVVVADFCRDYLLSKGISADKIEVVHNGIGVLAQPPQNRLTLRSQWHVSNDEMLLGVISRLDPVKGIDYLLTAFIGISKSYPSVKLIIIGTGTLDDYLKKKVHAEGLDQRVIFAGFRSDMEDCFDAIDVFILPSLAEYHSIALLEAMRARKPIIATDVGGNTESVRHEREALVVRPANSSEIENAIVRIHDEHSLRTRLSEAAYQRFLSDFTEDVTAQRTAQWLRRLA